MPLRCAVHSESGSECRQASASPISALESAIGPEGRANTLEALDVKTERSPTISMNGGDDSTD